MTPQLHNIGCSIRSTVRLISDAKYKEALTSLRATLVCLLSQNDDAKPTLFPLTNLELESITLRQNDDCEGELCADTNFSFGAFVLFDKAMQFPEAADNRLFSSSDNIHRASSVVLYNTALVHHLLGLKNSHRRRYHWEKALNIYDMTVKLFESCRTPTNVDAMTCLAVMNNKGHILSQLSELNRVQDCVDYIKSVFECGMDLERYCEDVVHFKITILQWNGELSAPAAPAA